MHGLLVYVCVCVYVACHKASVPETLEQGEQVNVHILTSGRALHLFIFVKILLLTLPCPFASLSVRQQLEER